MKSIGILGGMGHKATAYFYNRLLHYAAVVASERELPAIFISANTQMPSRTAALHGGRSPVPWLHREISWLQERAKIIACPCNSAHYFLKKMGPIPGFIDMVDLTMSKVSQYVPASPMIFIGGEVPRLTCLYGDVIYYEDPAIRSIIDNVKHLSDEDLKSLTTDWVLLLARVMSMYTNHRVVIGCSELSLINHLSNIENDGIIDSTEILAAETMCQATIGS